ncbi:MAG: 1-acyl-sn-glycerol-3-phosphate acyltransferase [Clostridia bacterium]|nr:1-acyl-sn-glycerol-3-phosphate acyltransferase [Clostridia bacterium]
MKIKMQKATHAQICAITPKRQIPKKPNMFFRTLLKVVSLPDLWATKFKATKIGMEKLGKKEPCLILMNHSSFIDLEIAVSVFYPRPLNIVATTDAFIGKSWLMRQIGCMETKKFVSDIQIVRDMKTMLKEKNSSVLMFPEAGYSLDGRATVLPDSLGKCVKTLGVPVVMLTTRGAFARQPLYNNLRKRKLNVNATVEYLLSPEGIAEKSTAELNAIIRGKFAFDNFHDQKEGNVVIDEANRAEGLERILYKCPNCGAEHKTVGAGTRLSCGNCGKGYELTPLGEMQAVDGATEFTKISDWVDWQRESVKKELENGEYILDTPVNVCAIVDAKCIYELGAGRLTHDANGFCLTGADESFTYKQSATAAYTINADFYFYQIADVINIGDKNIQYYCFPIGEKTSVFKARLAAEEAYKLARKK